MKRRPFLISVTVIVTVVIAIVGIVLFVGPYLVRFGFENRVLGIMNQVNSTESKTEVRSWFDSELNFTELYDWVHEKLRFVPINESFARHDNPTAILESGEGRCQEFSILYVAACLAHGYQSRLVTSVNISNPFSLRVPHAWAEVKLNSTWVHVDPSDKRWNEPYMYENRSWGENIDSTVRIYAFEEGKYEDVTLNYKRKD